MDLEKHSYFGLDFLSRFRAWLKPISPLTPGMDDVPRGSLLLMSSRARIVITKSINLKIPEGLKPIYEH
jgi:hypothetical protein